MPLKSLAQNFLGSAGESSLQTSLKKTIRIAVDLFLWLSEDSANSEFSPIYICTIYLHKYSSIFMLAK